MMTKPFRSSLSWSEREQHAVPVVRQPVVVVAQPHGCFGRCCDVDSQTKNDPA